MGRVHGRNGTLVLKTEDGETEYVITDWVIDTRVEYGTWPRITVHGYVVPEDEKGMR
jgi:hypothetical protein